MEDIKDALPEFLKEKNVKDLQGVRPWEDGYDETSLLIPEHYWKDFTPAMKQYWEIK